MELHEMRDAGARSGSGVAHVSAREWHRPYGTLSTKHTRERWGWMEASRADVVTPGPRYLRSQDDLALVLISLRGHGKRTRCSSRLQTSSLCILRIRALLGLAFRQCPSSLSTWRKRPRRGSGRYITSLVLILRRLTAPLPTHERLAGVGRQQWLPPLTDIGAILERDFPDLSSDRYIITSPSDRGYNCIAWAAGDDERWWWPAYGSYWPDGVERECTLDRFREAFELRGYGPCDSTDFETGYIKIVVYVTRLVFPPTRLVRPPTVSGRASWDALLISSTTLLPILEGSPDVLMGRWLSS